MDGGLVIDWLGIGLGIDKHAKTFGCLYAYKV